MTDRDGAGDAKPREVVLGEVVTSLLDASNPLPAEEAAQLLDLMPGRSPVQVLHPVQRVQSTDLGYGVDCQLPTGRGNTVRTIGIVSAHATLTGGHIIQGSARARVVVGVSTKRHRWSHYASRPGVLEVIQKAEPEELPKAFLDAPRSPALLDLGAIGQYVLDRAQNQTDLDRGARLKTGPTRLRWALEIREELTDPWADLTLEGDGTFLVRLQAQSADEEGIIRYCEDVALHAWLIAALNGAFERSLRPKSNRLSELAPALEYLGHLWHPGAHLPQRLNRLWTPIEDGAQLSREWSSQITRVRDAISLLSLRAQNEAITQSVEW